MDIRRFIRSALGIQIRAEGRPTAVQEEPIIKTILADPALTLAAVVYTVRHVTRANLHSAVRRSLMGQADAYKSHMDELADELIEHGLQMLNAYFGSHQLGDYLPPQLSAYAEQQRTAGQTVLLQAAFLKAVAHACPVSRLPVRDQLSAGAIERIRQRIVTAAPDPTLAERLLVAV